MMLLIFLTAAFGIWLFAWGLPWVEEGSMKPRVLPYLPRVSLGPVSKLEVRLHSLSRAWVPSEVDLEPRLRHAGSSLTPAAFRHERLMWGMGAAAAMAGLTGAGVLSGALARPVSAPILVALAGVSGMLLRDRVLARACAVRTEMLRDELPVAVDLMALSVMAGESVPSACERVSDAIGGAVGTELRSLLDEVQSGVPMTEALDRWGASARSPSVKRLATALHTSILRGAPLAEVLQGQSQDLRSQRLRDLMESGGRKEILMLVPVIFLVLPSIVMLVLYPGLMSLDLFVP
jgi:tight adherence protein C